MRLLKKKTDIHFMAVRRWAYLVSLALMLLSVVVLATRSLNFGLDFTGGTLIEVSFPGPADTELVRDNLRGAGLSDAVVQTFGAASDIVVRIPPRSEADSSAEISTLVLQALQQGVEGEVVMRRVEAFCRDEGIPTVTVEQLVAESQDDVFPALLTSATEPSKDHLFAAAPPSGTPRKGHRESGIRLPPRVA